MLCNMQVILNVPIALKASVTVLIIVLPVSQVSLRILLGRVIAFRVPLAFMLGLYVVMLSVYHYFNFVLIY